MRFIVGVRDAKANDSASGEMALIPVIFGDRGFAIIGAGIVLCRPACGGDVFVDDGNEATRSPMLDVLIYDCARVGGGTSLPSNESFPAGESGAIDCELALPVSFDTIPVPAYALASARTRSSLTESPLLKNKLRTRNRKCSVGKHTRQHRIHHLAPPCKDRSRQRKKLQ